jgi:hypothetical protein
MGSFYLKTCSPTLFLLAFVKSFQKTFCESTVLHVCLCARLVNPLVNFLKPSILSSGLRSVNYYTCVCKEGFPFSPKFIANRRCWINLVNFAEIQFPFWDFRDCLVCHSEFVKLKSTEISFKNYYVLWVLPSVLKTTFGRKIALKLDSKVFN